MDRMIYLAMNGAKHVAWQQATTANNLANVNTNGFKAEQVSFRALPVQGEGAPTRTYVVDNTIGYDATQGPLQQTGNPNDFALGTPGFFAVQTPDGQEAYTRAGGFVLDETGLMRTNGGLAILGDGGPITVPLGSKPQITQDGLVLAVPQSGADRTPQIVGQLKLVKPADKTDVYKGEDGLFHTQDGAPLQADQSVKVVSGAQEASNVNPVDSLIQMISHTRAYELNVKLMHAADQNAQSATQLLAFNS
jgi:flagellar basal-body rod protein FlgF